MAITNPTGAGETLCISAVVFGLLGVPVVTKNAGGPIDVVESGVSGILVDDERELPEAVVGLLRDENRRAEMGRNAMARVRSRFDSSSKNGKRSSRRSLRALLSLGIAASPCTEQTAPVAQVVV